MNWLYPWLRRWLFSRDAEWSHDYTLKQLQRLERSPFAFLLKQKVQVYPVELLGMQFPNPVGLAAGLDKNANCIDAFANMGFGFIEVGTVTPKSQLGNPKPRMFRIPEHRALINRMGFNNGGLDLFINNLKQTNYSGILGINIGKNKDTPEAEGAEDYRLCLSAVAPYASYITINVSSPNTPGLREMQHGQQLAHLLKTLKDEQAKQQRIILRYVPLLVKIAPDLDRDAVFALADILLEHQIDGVIATNTTLDRTVITGAKHANEVGGLSGLPVQKQSTQVIRWLREATGPDFPIIGVGGIEDYPSAADKIAAGANLVQIYTGFIYKGPRLIKDIVAGLATQYK